MKRLIATLAAITCAALALPQAGAVPPGGPRPNTPGTSVVIQGDDPVARVGSSSVEVVVTGFAPYAKYGVKIDDGRGYSDTSRHGTGNLATPDAHFDANGSATFSISPPCGVDQSLPKHTIRVLSKDGDKFYSSLSVNTCRIESTPDCPA